jgi:zinc protease
MALYVQGGTYAENEKNFGTHELMGAMLRKGGAGNKTADEVDRKLSELAATISTSIGGEFGLISMECLEKDVDEVFGIMSDIVFRPRFQQDRFQLLKKQYLENIARRKDNPWSIGSIAFNQLIYGNDSILGRSLSSSDVRRLQTWQLRRTYRDYIKPNQTIIAVTGKIELDHLKELLDKEFAYLKALNLPINDIQSDIPIERPRVVFIESDLEQATIMLGQLGVPRYAKDHFPTLVYNEVFANGMSSLLSRKIRSQLGLAYFVYGGMIPGLVRGKNIVALQTKADSVGASILEAIKLIEQTRTYPINSALLDEKKRGMSASYVFAHDSARAILGRIISLELMGYPKDYDAKYLEKINNVTSKDVLTLAQNRWHTNMLTILIVGNHKALESFLAVRDQLPPVYTAAMVEQGTFNEILTLRPDALHAEYNP